MIYADFPPPFVLIYKDATSSSRLCQTVLADFATFGESVVLLFSVRLWLKKTKKHVIAYQTAKPKNGSTPI